MAAVSAERDRQDRLKAAGRFTHTCADPMSNADRLIVLIEEVGEVARAIMPDEDRPATWRRDLRAELVQVAAVAVAWVEGIDTEDGP